MKIVKFTTKDSSFPQSLLHIAGPPKALFVLGNVELLQSPHMLAVVGARAVTPYGRRSTDELVSGAASKGIVIVSGLALGVDGIAHRAALQVRGKTIAVLANGLDAIYPASHRTLAKQILEQGGALVSEYPEGTEAFKHHFIARNRIVSGLCQAVLITEATEKSGSLHTAKFALEQGKEVMAVPGNITSPMSMGTNNLIKSGAMPITSTDDILNYFGISHENRQTSLLGANQEEQTILDLMQQGITDSAELLFQSKLAAAAFNQTLTMLEITGHIKPLGNNHWSLL